MSDAWASFPGDASIRQGDVVKKVGPVDQVVNEYAVILTADCDIAQKKSNNRMTLIRAVPINEFVGSYWASWELEKLVEKQLRAVTPFFSACAGKIDPSLRALTDARLLAWVRSDSPDEIFDVLGVMPTKHAKEFAALSALKGYVVFLEDQQDRDGLAALSRAYVTLGRSLSDIRDRVREALTTNSGFQDYLIIPNCPDNLQDGLAILMREVFTIPAEDILQSEYQARVQDRINCFARIGRLRDRVKYAVTQRIAFVFSRIGMEAAYEDSCQTLADLIALEALQ